MKKRTYLYQEELDRLMDYLRVTKYYDYYFIIYNMTHLEKSYNELKKLSYNKLVFPSDIPVPTKNPFGLSIRGINKQLKIIQTRVGIREVVISTKLFSKKFFVGGIVCYGKLIENKNNYEHGEYGHIYMLKHCHRNPEVSKMLTDKKIGISIDYEKRVKGITLGPVGVEVIKTWKIPTRVMKKMERQIHKTFIDCNIVGEWFDDPNDILMERVDNLLMGIYV